MPRVPLSRVLDSSVVRSQLEGAIQFLVAALVVAVAAASSDIDFVNVLVARPMRWILLGQLCGAALAYALVRRGFPRPSAVVALGALFLLFAFLSASWSPEPRLTVGRSVTFAVLLLGGGALASGARGESLLARQIMLGLLAAAVVVAVAGLFSLWVHPDRALVHATRQTPTRYAGIGGNPNTPAMLLALSIPLAVWALIAARSRRRRVLAGCVLLLFLGSIIASGSRGALAGALAGVLLFALALKRERRLRIVLAGTSIAVFALGVGIMQLPQPADRDPPPKSERTPVSLGPRDAQAKMPLQDEIGFPRPGSTPHRRSFFDSSGRAAAWEGALDQAALRPILGYGFGTEQEVFVDRFFLFYSSVPENSYIGALLQVGAVGLALLLAFLSVIVVGAWRMLSQLDDGACRVAGALLGVVACGLTQGVSQSYMTSAGAPAAPTFWLCALLLAGLAGRPLRALTRVEKERN